MTNNDNVLYNSITMAESTGKSIFIRLIFIVGIIILLIAFAIGLSKLFGKFEPLSSGFFKKTEKISFEINKTIVKPNEAFVVSWKNLENKGVYYISYKCGPSASLSMVKTAGTVLLDCNKQYPIDPSINQIKFIPQFTNSSTFEDLDISINFIKENEAKPSAAGNVSITISDDPQTPTGNLSSKASEITSTPTKNSNPVYTTNSYVSNVPTDLMISDLSIIQNRIVEFTVSNIGGKDSGIWDFNYETPDGEVTNSPAQISLRPGEALRYTLKFDNQLGKGDVIIVLDAFRRISENNENNNSVSVKSTGSGSSNSSNGNYSGKADFVIENLESGYLKSNDRFVEDETIDSNDDPAIRFTVINKGGKSTDDWRFTIKTDGVSYTSPRQDSLDSGEEVEIIYGFEELDSNETYDIEIEIDSGDDTDEKSESNNDDNVDLEID